MQCREWEVPGPEKTVGEQVRREAALIGLHVWHALRGPLVPPAPALREGERRTVILVPGFLGRSESFVPMQRALNAAGHPCYILPLGFQMGDILKKGREFTDLVNRHDLDDVFVVAHSTGGLITLAAMLQGEKRIRHTWCLGTPLFGSVNVSLVFLIAMLILLWGIPTGYGAWMLAAGVFLVPILRQLAPESVLLRVLRQNYDQWQNVTSVFAKFDEISLSSPWREPGSTSRFGRSSDIHYPQIGHNNLYMGSAAIKAVVRAVNAADDAADQEEAERMRNIPTLQPAQRTGKSATC